MQNEVSLCLHTACHLMNLFYLFHGNVKFLGKPLEK